MPAGTIREWLDKKRRNECAVGVFSSFLGIAGGLFILAITFGVLYFLVVFFSILVRHGVVPSTNATVAICSFLLALLFLESLRTRREDLPGAFSAGLWLFRELFCAGPWLLLSAGRNAARAFRLTRLDLDSCERVLSFLAARNTSASRDEVLHALPGLKWSDVIAHLLLLEGVLFFRPDLSRVSITEPLRLELRRLLKRKPSVQADEPRAHSHQRPAEPIPVTEPGSLSCYELLGVSPKASLAEIKTAYRKRMKECHPDRFASVDCQYQPLAEEWAKAINAAYATLAAQHASPSR